MAANHPESPHARLASLADLELPGYRAASGLASVLAPDGLGLPDEGEGTLTPEARSSLVPTVTKWSWASRHLPRARFRVASALEPGGPVVGDLALVRVGPIGFHSSIVTAENRKLRLYPGDLLVGVFGHRYATDAFEAQVEGVDRLSLLTAGGLIGTVRSRHQEMAKPTPVTFVGFLQGPTGERSNLKRALSRPPAPPRDPRNLLVVVGTGMNAGKTTVASRLIHALVQRNHQVAAVKLTGSVSHRDQDEMRAAGAHAVADFSDHGFPSTYLAPAEELVRLRRDLLADVGRIDPDVVVMEIADGVLQRETALILADPTFRAQVRGILLAADSALGALAAIARLKEWGYRVLAVSGALTSSPLYMREFAANSEVPIVSSAGLGGPLGEIVEPHLLGVRPRGAEPHRGWGTGGLPLAGEPAPPASALGP